MADRPPLWIVDGDNAVHAAGSSGDHARDRARLIGEVTDRAARLGVECVLVFDGAGSGRSVAGTTVRFSGSVTADTVIERLAHGSGGAGREVTVVSSDAGIRHVAHRDSVHVMSVREFLDRLQTPPDQPRGTPPPAHRYKLVDALDPASRAALERIRRES